MKKIELDDLDISLLRACREKSGKPLAEICQQFLGPRSQRTLYYRVKDLENSGLIRIDRAKERGRALCYLEESGEEVLLGREEHSPNEQACKKESKTAFDADKLAQGGKR